MYVCTHKHTYVLQWSICNPVTLGPGEVHQITEVAGISKSISMWVTSGTRLHDWFRKGGRLTEAGIREVSLYARMYSTMCVCA